MLTGPTWGKTWMEETSGRTKAPADPLFRRRLRAEKKAQSREKCSRQEGLGGILTHQRLRKALQAERPAKDLD